MTKTIRQLLLPAILVALAVIAPAQASANALDVQRDCADSDVFEREHSKASLKAALRELQADAEEYTDCGQMIRDALAAMKGGGGGGGASIASNDLDGDGVISPEEEQIAEEKAEKRKERAKKQAEKARDLLAAKGFEVDEGDDDSSGTVATAGGGGGGSSSLGLILAIVALACAAIGGGLWYAGKHNPAIGNALRRVPVPFRNS